MGWGIEGTILVSILVPHYHTIQEYLAGSFAAYEHGRVVAKQNSIVV